MSPIKRPPLWVWRGSLTASHARVHIVARSLILWFHDSDLVREKVTEFREQFFLLVTLTEIEAGAVKSQGST